MNCHFRPFILFFLALCLGVGSLQVANATKADVDSLQQLLDGQLPDTTRINLLNKQAWAWRHESYDDGIRVAQQALELSAKIKDSEFTAHSHLTIARLQRKSGSYPEALDHALEALNGFRELDRKRDMGNCYNTIGLINKNQGNYDMALDYLERSLKVDEEFGIPSDIAVSLNNIGLIHYHKGDYNRALDYFLRSLRYREDENDRSGMAGCFLNIGLIYHERTEYTQAAEYYRNAASIYEELGYRGNASVCYNNLGLLYYDRGEPEVALSYYRRSLDIKRALGSRSGMAGAYNNIGDIYRSIDRPDSAAFYFQKSLAIRREIGDRTGIGEVSSSLGQLNLERGRYNTALVQLDTAMTIGKSSGSKEIVRAVAEAYMDYYGSVGQYEKAFEYQILERQMADSLDNESRAAEIARLETQYRMGQLVQDREREAERIKTEREIEVARQETVIFWLIVALSLVGVLMMAIVVNFRLRQRFRRDKRERDAAYQQLVESASDIIYRADPLGFFTYVNPTAIRIMGRTREEELIGRHFSELVREDQREEVIGFYRKQFDDRKKASYLEFPVTDTAGKEIWLGQNVQAAVENDRITQFTAVARDITELKKVQEALVKAKEQAESSQQAKEQFLANMSHEIRTPINGIVGMAHLLEQSSLTKEQRDYLETISFSSDHLLSIVNDILDLSKIESGQVAFESIPFRLTEQIEFTIKPLQWQASEKGIGLEVKQQGMVPDSIKSDPLRLRQVLFNLVSNALKFTEKGKVTVNYSYRDLVGDNLTLVVSVKDTGIGISLENQERIFNNFTQANSDTTRQYGGTGLGLTIARQLVEQQGGSMFLESTPGKGSTFWFELPVTLASDEEEEHIQSPEPSVEMLKGCRVLAADDNPTGQLLLRRLLESWGCEAEVVSTGREALDAIKKADFEVAVLDVQMPEMDGYDAARGIRKLEEPQKRDIPILALTAHALGDEADRCRDAGMNDFMSKPFSPAKLRAKLALLAGREVEMAIPEVMPRDSETHFDMAYLYEATNGDPDFMIDMLRSFATRNVQEVEQLEKAISDSDALAVRQCAHRMAPTYEYVGSGIGVRLIESIGVLANANDLGEKMQETFQELKTSSAETRSKLVEKINDLEKTGSPVSNP